MRTVIVYPERGKKYVVKKSGIAPEWSPLNYNPDPRSKEYKMQESDHFAACRELKRRHGNQWEKSVGYSETELKNIWEMGR